MRGLAVGRIVHYVLDNGQNTGEHRPAQIVHVWNDSGMVNLVVTLDGLNDTDAAANGVTNDKLHMWATSRMFDDVDKRPGTWHWIEQA